MTTAAGYEDYYEQNARQYDECRLDREIEVDATIDAFRIRRDAPADVLEIGCGTARYGYRLAQCGYSVVGLDSSAAQLRHATRLGTLVHASAANMPLSAESFDASLAVLVIHQMDAGTRRSAFAEVARILRPGGLFCIKTCSRSDLRQRPFSAFFPSSVALNERRYPDVATLEAELQAAGFGALETESTRTRCTVAREWLLDAFASMHNTTLALIPAQELRSGCSELAHHLAETPRVTIEHHHTLVFATRANLSTMRSSRLPHAHQVPESVA